MSLLSILLLSLFVVSNPAHYSQKHHTVLHNISFGTLDSCDVSLSKLSKSSLYLSKWPSKSTKSSSLYLAFLLLSVSKDIELNPGPTKYPCQICNKAVKWTTPGMCCDTCDGWYHKSCMGMNSAVYRGLRNVSWHCCQCGMPNFSMTLFDIICLNESNPFSLLSTTPLSPQIPDVDIGSPSASSSPKPQKNQKAKSKGWNDIPVKVAVINCRSIVKKKAELLNVLDATQADVIIGTESWLTNSIPDSEVCPPGYSISRKDRDSGIGGGVFILTSNDFVF